MIGCDRDFNIRLWNEAAAKLTEFRQADVLRRNISTIFTLQSLQKVMKHLHSERRWITKIRSFIQNKSGESFPALVYISKIERPLSSHISTIISFLDMRGEQMLKSQQSQIEQLATIAQLSGSIMHDIRNPINAVSLNADVVQTLIEKDTVDIEALTKAVERIHRQIERLKANLDQYLGYSRVSDLNLVAIDVTPKLNEFIEESRANLAGTNMQIRYKKPSKEMRVLGDWIQLRRVFQNLLQNALEANENRGYVVVSMSRRQARVYLRIRDNGPGLPEAQMDKVFDPFFTTKDHGTGLGLFICREIVKAHGGNLIAKNLSSGGAEFSFSIPILADPAID
jgi:PAS domain S-box-containing protein